MRIYWTINMQKNKLNKYLLCYDISDTKRLGRIYRFVIKVAIPLQYSVFQLLVSNDELELIVGKLEEMIDKKEDDIRIYPLHTRNRTYLIGNSFFPEGVILLDD